MPHQCLKCGRIFEEGSQQLLKGCPDCGGNRFFFTKEPLDQRQRDTISQQVNKDITAKIMEALAEKQKDKKLIKSGKWVPLKPNEIREILQEKIETKEEPPEPISEEPIQPITKEEDRKQIIDRIKEEVDEFQSPETIDIEKPGEYNIDLKGLLENEPIIIQKDGTYTIHLPSVFKMLDDKE
jgi:predicted  nucleic acid-binding Zn-ribbon protein